MVEIVENDRCGICSDVDNEKTIAHVRKKVNDMMKKYPLFAW